MKYVLMHKNIPVVTLELDDVTCVISKIDEVFNESHLPVGVHIRNGIINRGELNQWWIDRAIPSSRSGIKKALEVLNLSDTKMLLTKCLGLSLLDQYWIRPIECEDLKWKDINFFDNSFSEDIGDVLLGKTVKQNVFNFHSPDNTSDGYLKKCWKIIDGKRCLIKAGSAPLMLQPFNEVIASIIMEKLNIPHVTYKLLWDDNVPYSVCEDFINHDTELVSAYRVMQMKKRNNNTSIYRHFINCCCSLGIKNITHFLDQMIVIDYIIANEDRHLNNFGLIRNAETLEWIGASPIFDSGSSLGYNKLPSGILTDDDISCKPFKKTHEKQLKLVTNYDWIDFKALENIDDDIRNVFKGAGIYADENRIDAIITSVKNRISNLHSLALNKTIVTDNIKDDVLLNIEETYND